MNSTKRPDPMRPYSEVPLRFILYFYVCIIVVKDKNTERNRYTIAIYSFL